MDKKVTEYFIKEIQPICSLIDNYLGDQHINYAHTILALAAILGTKIDEIDKNSELSISLGKFVKMNIKNELERQTRENN